MLRLQDHRTGQATPIAPARGVELRTYTMWDGPADADDPAGLRGFLLADLIRRVAERHRLVVSAWQNTGAGAGAGAGSGVLAALNIHPAQFAPEAPDPLDVTIVAGASDDAGPPGRWVRAGQVQAGGATAAGLMSTCLDPLALRLMFMGAHYRQPVTVSQEALAAAAQTLSRWREQVADWARSPSKPMCARYLTEITAAFDDDLATPAALAGLHALAADAEIPPGSKFEAFAHLDQLFGLDLAAQVGR